MERERVGYRGESGGESGERWVILGDRGRERKGNVERGERERGGSKGEGERGRKRGEKERGYREGREVGR